MGGHNVTSNTKMFTIPSNVASPTSFRSILLGTAAYAALPGVPAPNHIIVANFFSLSADTVTYVPYDSTTFSAGQMPTNGTHSFNKGIGSAPSSPRNYSGATGTVYLASAPAIPDGRSGSQPVRVSKLNTAGTSLSVTFDTTTCSDPTPHTIVWGDKAQLPTSVGGAFGLRGSVCNIGSSPYTWSAAPSAADGAGLVWWLIVSKNTLNKEGSWGENELGAERVGPGTGGSSGQCGADGKNAVNACGH